MDRQLDLLADSARAIKKAIKNLELVDAHILMSYLEKISSLEAELQGARRGSLLLDDYGERVRKAPDIKQSLFDLRVAISCLMEQTKKVPSPQVLRTPMLAGVNLHWIEIPTFDGSILNWRLF